MPEGPRAVTPLGIAADLLGSVHARLAARPDGADREVLADLERAQRLVGGLEEYVAASTTPASEALVALEERTRAQDWGQRAEQAGVALEQEMLSGHVEGRLLAMLVGLTGATRVLEVGMFTGYAALAMAEALPDGGRVVTCELDAATAALAQECFAASPAGDRIRVEVGPAARTLAHLAEAGHEFDMVFVDADKAGYTGYLDTVLGLGGARGLLADGGLVCIDNTLLQGEPWAGGAGPDGAPSGPGRAIADFNARVVADDRLEQVLVPLRDGLTLIRRAR